MRIGGVTVGKVKEPRAAARRQRDPRRDRDRPAVRADLLRRQGDPAPEDAARRDLRRADDRHPDERARTRAADETATAQSGAIDVGQISRRRRAAPDRGGRPPRGHPGRRSDPDRRDLQRPRRGDPPGLPALDEELGRSRSTAAGSTSTTPSATSGPSRDDASDVLGTLREQEEALRGVVRNTGAVFQALTARDQALAGADRRLQPDLRARLASRDEALAETFKIFPTFQIESRLTLERLEKFADNARPAVPRPAAGGPRPQPDAARRAPARTQPAPPVQEPRPADQGLGDRPAVAAQLPRRAAGR